MIRIGTRSSPLALTQATLVRDALTLAHPTKRIEIIPFTTRGDKTTKSLHDIGGKALFTKELQDALLTNTIDAAVHSLKDVELHDLPLVLGAYLAREVPHDVLITRKDHVIPVSPSSPSVSPSSTSVSLSTPTVSPSSTSVSLSTPTVSLWLDHRAHTSSTQAHGSPDHVGGKLEISCLFGTLGTCSPRRASQAKCAWPDIAIVDLRGNVGTRLQQVVDGKIDATILAAAGLTRLGLMGDAFAERYPTLEQTPLPLETFIPAAGQGIVAIECRPKDAALFAPINDANAMYCAETERLFAKNLGGNCRTALGAHVRFVGGESANDANKTIEVLSFFEGRTLNRIFKVGADVESLAHEIHDMANALRR